MFEATGPVCRAPKVPGFKVFRTTAKPRTNPGLCGWELLGEIEQVVKPDSPKRRLVKPAIAPVPPVVEMFRLSTRAPVKDILTIGSKTRFIRAETLNTKTFNPRPISPDRQARETRKAFPPERSFYTFLQHEGRP